MENKRTYQDGKERARKIAIDWQLNNSDYNYSYEGITIVSNYFYNLGKRFGLLREFRENAIPC